MKTVEVYGSPNTVKIAPSAARQFLLRRPLEEARRAHEMLGEGGVLGKIVLLPHG